VKPQPDLDTFLALCRPGRAIPVRVEIEADTETPVSAFLKLSRGERHAFLLESVEGGERSARFSFLGAGPRSVLSWKLGDPGDPIDRIRKDLATHQAVRVEGTPRFSGGLVGWLSYDAVKLFEPRVPISKEDELGFPDACFMDFDLVVAFDGRRHSIHVIAEARCGEGDDPRALYAAAVARIDKTLATLARPLKERRRAPSGRPPSPLRPRISRVEYEAAVRRAKEYIKAGDCQQIVLSQRFEADVDVAPFDVYRALRRVNPSPYLFYLQDGERALVGSSPETLIKLEAGEVTLRPIAGTRRRGADPADDARLEAELRADPKENAEHVMLVDLGRNDVGRVAEIGTVRVTALKTVERYSHVMHLVSEVRGKLAKGLSAVDVLRAGFPAGTVSGSPKVRAMEIIDELEPARRGPYAGAAGYFDRGGNMEMCIAIRTLAQRGRRVTVQAGGGLVYDSKPADEYMETVNKARACFTAVAQAQSGTLDAVAPAVVGEVAGDARKRERTVRAERRAAQQPGVEASAPGDRKKATGSAP
jgi:anthranilate synthase component I